MPGPRGPHAQAFCQAGQRRQGSSTWPYLSSSSRRWQGRPRGKDRTLRSLPRYSETNFRAAVSRAQQLHRRPRVSCRTFPGPQARHMADSTSTPPAGAKEEGGSFRPGPAEDASHVPAVPNSTISSTCDRRSLERPLEQPRGR
jgi:hypothetical protein